MISFKHVSLRDFVLASRCQSSGTWATIKLITSDFVILELPDGTLVPLGSGSFEKKKTYRAYRNEALIVSCDASLSTTPQRFNPRTKLIN